MKEQQLTKNKYIGLLAAVIIGCMAFMAIYGLTPLDVTNDRWIMELYDERDILTHYAGWEAYRDSPWSFPLGHTDNMAVGEGVIISFTDSIPWVAMVFKAINGILPNTFQFFGWFTLLCYILQTVAAFMILSCKTKDTVFSLAGSVLFSFAPILMERAFRHTALGAQWLVLFAIYLYFVHKDTPKTINHIWMLLLLVLSIGIHPYFLPMIACFALLCVAEDAIKGKYKNMVIFPLQLGITYAAGYIIGVVGHGVSSSRSGFGHYSMNINAVVNPTSVGGYTWSKFLPVLPNTAGNYDGFNYLGAGIMAGLVLAAVLLLASGRAADAVATVKRHLPLLAVSIFLTCFALSHIICLNENIIFTAPLPEKLVELGGIFRSSGRMFYPVYYLLFIWVVVSVYRCADRLKKPVAYGVLAFIVALQLYDISGCIVEKHTNMYRNGRETSILDDVFLNEVFSNSDELLEIDIHRYDERQLAVLAFKKDMTISYELANSGEYPAAEALRDRKIEEIISTGDLQDYIVVLSEEEEAQRFAHCEDAIIYAYKNSFLVFRDKGYQLSPQ